MSSSRGTGRFAPAADDCREIAHSGSASRRGVAALASTARETSWRAAVPGATASLPDALAGSLLHDIDREGTSANEQARRALLRRSDAACGARDPMAPLTHTHSTLSRDVGPLVRPQQPHSATESTWPAAARAHSATSGPTPRSRPPPTLPSHPKRAPATARTKASALTECLRRGDAPEGSPGAKVAAMPELWVPILKHLRAPARDTTRAPRSRSVMPCVGCGAEQCPHAAEPGGWPAGCFPEPRSLAAVALMSSDVLWAVLAASGDDVPLFLTLELQVAVVAAAARGRRASQSSAWAARCLPQGGLLALEAVPGEAERGGPRALAWAWLRGVFSAGQTSAGQGPKRRRLGLHAVEGGRDDLATPVRALVAPAVLDGPWNSPASYVGEVGAGRGVRLGQDTTAAAVALGATMSSLHRIAVPESAMLAALSTTGLCGQLKVVDLRLTCCVDAARTLRAVQARGCAAGPALPTLEKLSVQLIQPRKQDLAAVRLLALAAPSLLTLRLDAREADPGCGPMNVEGLTSLRSVAVSGPVAVDVGAEPMPRLVSLRFDRLPSDNTIAARINGRILTALHHLDARCLVSPFQSVDATRLLPGLSTLTGLTSLSTVLSDASAVEGLTGLERLSASAAPGGDLSGVRCLSRLSAMVSLTLSSSRTSLAARDVAGLPDTLTKLRELTLWCSLSPGALAALSKATQLTALSIDASARQQTGGAAHDADHPESVGRGWDWLSRLAGLQVLEIHSPADLGDDGGGLGELPSLRELRLRGGALRSAHVRAAGSCRRLRRLHIGPMTLEDMDPLVMLLAPGSFAKLRELELCGLRGLGRTGAGLVQRLSRGTRSVKDQVIVGWVLRKLSSAGVAVTTKGLKF